VRFSGIRVATVAAQGLSPDEVDLRGRVALLFGAEGAGLTEALVRAADVRVSIPMARGIESLNVGAAAAVLLLSACVSCSNPESDGLERVTIASR